jgi:cyclophilin family peptidyl-prolyl cis-trans isomerase
MAGSALRYRAPVPTDKRQRQRANAAAKAAAARAAQRRRSSRRRAVGGGAAVVVVVGIIALLIGTSTSKTKKPATTTTTAAATATTALHPTAKYGTTPCPKPDGSSPRTEKFTSPFGQCLDPGKTYTASMVTDAGTMQISFDTKDAPATVNNFVALARSHFYDGLSFHRVIPSFVDQGGDPLGTGAGGPGYTFADELPAAGAYKVGSLAMANSGPNTNGSQFFIIVGAQGAQLPPQYSLFGMVTSGIDVAHKIEADGTQGGTPKVVHKIVTVTVAEH